MTEGKATHSVTLIGLRDMNPIESAEVLFEQVSWDGQSLESPLMTLESANQFIQAFKLGRISGLRVQVLDQKAINALAGYFWVEPRRLA